METVCETRGANKLLIKECWAIQSPTVWHRKLLSCAQQLQIALNRLQLFETYLLTDTINKVEAVLQGLQHAIRILQTGPQLCPAFRDQQVALAVRQLWQNYFELVLAVKIQEVTTPAVHIVPRKSNDEEKGEKMGSPLSKSQSMAELRVF